MGKELDTQELVERLRVLSNATRAFAAASLATDVLLDVVVREVAESVKCSCAVSTVLDDGLHFTTTHVHASDPSLVEAYRNLHVMGQRRPISAHPGMKHVTTTRTPFVLHRADLDAMRANVPADVVSYVTEARVNSAIVVPLVARDDVIGALALMRHGDQDELDGNDLALAVSLGDHAALAIMTARSFEQSNRELRVRAHLAARLRLLSEASQAFAEATDDYDRLLEVIARRLGQLLGDQATIRAISADRRSLEPGAIYHRDPEIVAAAQKVLGMRQLVGEGIMGSVAASGEPLFLPRIDPAEFAAASSRPEFREYLTRLNVGSAMVVPMKCRDEAVGVAMLVRSHPCDPYTEDDLNLLRSVADHAALAIANARSYAAEKRTAAASKLLFEASPVPLIVFDIETLEILAVNAATVRLYGYTHAELVRATLLLLVAEDAHETLRARVAGFGDDEGSGIVTHRRKDGSPLVIEFTSRRLLVDDHHARIVVINDITARHDALRTSALLAAIVRTSNDAIISKTLDGTITSWNGAAEALFGYSAIEAIGKPITILIPPDRLAEEPLLLRRLTAGERIDRYETIRVRKDGRELPVSLSIAPILDASGVVVGASKIARDLTAERQTAEALRRTADQLRQSQKMDAVGRLAGGIAHDFNNALSIVLSYSELMLADVAPGAPCYEELGEIRQAAVRAGELTRQLLVFSRQKAIVLEPLDLNAVITGMHRMLTRILGEDIELDVAPAPNLGRVLADASSIDQVIMNLVVNARDAMPTGGRITIETKSVVLDDDYVHEHVGAQAGPHVMLAVSDTGIGMDRATQARIFEPFFTTKEVGKGTGLGLSMVFGIVQQCGGNVWVYSEPGKGTTFKVYLPRTDTTPTQVADAWKPSVPRGSETILLVEDQEGVRKVAESILRRAGYSVMVARDADEALVICEQHTGAIQLLLTDVIMPRMSGPELAKRVTASRPAMKLLFMSGYTDDSIVRHGMLAGEMSFLQKPFTPETLARKVREVLGA